MDRGVVVDGIGGAGWGSWRWAGLVCRGGVGGSGGGGIGRVDGVGIRSETGTWRAGGGLRYWGSRDCVDGMGRVTCCTEYIGVNWEVGVACIAIGREGH